MRSQKISPELLEECSKIVHEYVQRTRKWSKEEYYIKFSSIDYDTKEVDFSVVNIKDKEDFIKSLPLGAQQGKIAYLGHYPLWFSVLIKFDQMKVTHEEWVRRKEFLPLHPEFNIPEYPPYKQRQ